MKNVKRLLALLLAMAMLLSFAACGGAEIADDDDEEEEETEETEGTEGTEGTDPTDPSNPDATAVVVGTLDN